MDRAPPQHARRPIAPFAVASTVAAAPARPRRIVNPAAIVVAVLLAGAAIALNSPLVEALDFPDEGAWRFIGFWAEGGCVLAALGMLFRQPAAAWIGAGAYFGVSLVMAFVVWPAHLVSIVLLVAVAAWAVEERADRPKPPQAYPPYPPYPYPHHPAQPSGWQSA